MKLNDCIISTIHLYILHHIVIISQILNFFITIFLFALGIFLDFQNMENSGVAIYVGLIIMNIVLGCFLVFCLIILRTLLYKDYNISE